MHENHALAPEARARLEAFLDGGSNENGLGFVATHGFLTALTVAPESPAIDVWLSELFDKQPVANDPGLATQIAQDLDAWRKEIHAALYHGHPLALPCTLAIHADEPTDLNDWCAGFMEGMFLKEASWYDSDEDLVADLTLPMMVLSDLIDDPDIRQIRHDKKISRELAQQIPDVLTELYLHFHAPKTA